MIHRHALWERMRESAATVVMLVAPAGFGKTTTMLQLRKQLEADGVLTGWITLESGDNDAEQLMARIDRAAGGFTVQARTSGAAKPIALLERFEQAPGPVALFVDEAELLTEATAWQLLRQIVERLPKDSRLVIGSRQQPALSLSRLRANSKLVEFDSAQLRFSLQEANELFGLRLDGGLSRHDCETLVARTEGWPAALVLAVIAIERQADPRAFIDRFSGSTRSVSDYLTDEVLCRQSAEMQEFLLGTCILRQLSPALCQALLPRLNCGFLLEQLTHANLFLTPVESESGEWRYHALFADFLRQHLLATDVALHARLHLAASGWYEREGRFDQAIDHAIEGDDYPYAVTLLNQHAESFLAQGRLRLLARWFDLLPQKSLREHEMLQVCAVWATAYSGGGAAAQHRLENSACQDSTDPAIRAHLSVLRPLLLAIRDRPAEAYALARESAQSLPTGNTFTDYMLTTLTGQLAAAHGDREGAARLLDNARRHGDTPFGRTYIEAVEGELDLQDGLLRQGVARIRIALQASNASSQGQQRANGFAAMLYAYTVYEHNQLAEAEQLLRIYLPVMQSMGLNDHEILGALMLARIATEWGDPDEAVRVLAAMEDQGYRHRLPRLIATAHLERARQLTMKGDAIGSKAALAQADNPQVWQPERELRRLAHTSNDLVMGQLRWAAHFGSPAAALAQIEVELARARTQHRHLRAMTLALLRCALLHRTNRLPEALDAARRLLRNAADQGFMRHVLDEGPLLRPLLTTLACSMDHVGHSADPVLQEYVQRLLHALPVGANGFRFTLAEEGGGTRLRAPTEPLTPKELEALRLLAEGCSNGVMAERMLVSDSTVRTHLRNINTKLHAKSRSQAVARARECGFIA